MSPFPSKKCGVLGCTGSVGQRFILLLANHPHFTLHAVGASSRSAGKTYKEAVRWKQATSMSEALGSLVVRECIPSEFEGCDLIFSGLDSDVAGEIGLLASLLFVLITAEEKPETAFLKANHRVLSNASSHRQNPLVPLIVPTINTSHFSLIPHQRTHYSLSTGFLVCNSNCAVIGLVIPFAALQAAFGPISTASIVTLQAVSGAGYPGVSSMDILDNTIPFIKGEEDKIQPEARKILGTLNAEQTGFAMQEGLRISATCNRVPVLDGHSACVALKFEKQPPPSVEKVKAALSGYVSEAQKMGCPRAPERAIVVMEEPDRPQPRLDRDMQDGYGVCVGRVRVDESGIWDLMFTALSHNTIIGAAGSSIINAEAAVLMGYA
ncbi:MAG: hypothetical protein M1814_006082 [Vezdaea aestivalis]|nr:MAG: hypothetical protein M1814_006082 [Vezdaea aestivalis]